MNLRDLDVRHNEVLDQIIRPMAVEIAVQLDADQVVYSYEPDVEKQRKDVKEFWDRHHKKRVEFEAYQRRERIRRAVVVVKPFAAAVGAIAAGGAVLYVFTIARAIFR